MVNIRLADGNTFMNKGEEVKVKVESGQLVVYKGSTRSEDV